MNRFYKLTVLGRRQAGSTSPSRRNRILDHMYRSPDRTAGTEELSHITGMSVGATLAEMKRLERSGYVIDISD